VNPEYHFIVIDTELPTPNLTLRPLIVDAYPSEQPLRSLYDEVGSYTPHERVIYRLWCHLKESQSFLRPLTTKPASDDDNDFFRLLSLRCDSSQQDIISYGVNMSVHNSRRGPNMSQFIANLNSVDPQPAEELFSGQDTLGLFATTDFFDFDMGDDLNMPGNDLDIAATERKARNAGWQTSADTSGQPFLDSKSLRLFSFQSSLSQSSSLLSALLLLSISFRTALVSLSPSPNPTSKAVTQPFSAYRNLPTPPHQHNPSKTFLHIIGGKCGPQPPLCMSSSLKPVERGPLVPCPAAHPTFARSTPFCVADSSSTSFHHPCN
jgi:hypothetical protein